MKRIKKIKPGGCLLLALASLTIFSCDRGREVRKYNKKEIPAVETRENPAAQMRRQAAPQPLSFQWETPPGWSEVRQSSGIRLAAFSIKSSAGESMCTIIPFNGTAGGIRANVNRWLAQINIQIDPEGKDFEQFLGSGEEFETRGHFPAVFFDFTPVTPGPGDPSILATVITAADSTIFIKMTGSKAELIKNREPFKSLSLSFTAKPAK